MDAKKIQAALADIRKERDPTIKALKLASLCTALWKERGVQLVVVGGSAIELLTEGAYASGDIDMCTIRGTLRLRDRQDVMAQLGAKGGPRSWQVEGLYVDLLGEAESFARTPFRRVQGPYGEVLVMKPEDLLVERVLVSYYPETTPSARECAKKFIAVVLGGAVAVDWNEVRRLANRPEYRNLAECEQLVQEVANELETNNPLHSD
jgi:hypothetical protein